MKYQIGNKFEDKVTNVIWEIKEITGDYIRLTTMDPDLGELSCEGTEGFMDFQVENGIMIPVVDTNVDNDNSRFELEVADKFYEDYLEAYKASGFTASNWDIAVKTAVAKAMALGVDYSKGPTRLTDNTQSELLKVGNRVIAGEVKGTITRIDPMAKEVTVNIDNYTTHGYENVIVYDFDFFKEYFKLINEETLEYLKDGFTKPLTQRFAAGLVNYTGCYHDYKRYEGLIETYDYCILCNKKREE